MNADDMKKKVKNWTTLFEMDMVTFLFQRIESP